MRKREREVMLKLYHKTHPYCTAFPRQLLLVSYLGLRNNKDKERERGGRGTGENLRISIDFSRRTHFTVVLVVAVVAA